MTLQELFRNCVKKHSGNEAIVARDKRVSYNDLAEQVASFQAGLKKIGIKKGESIGLLLGNSIEFVVSYFGSVCSGNIVIPLNPTLTSEELAYIAKDASITTVVSMAPLEPLISQLKEKVPALKNTILTSTVPESKKGIPGWFSFSDWMNEKGRVKEEEISPDEVAAILYTSGTTGKPKGAMLTHKNLFSNTMSAYRTLGCSDKDCFLVSLPLFHAFQATVGMLVPLVSGCKMVILDEFKPSTIFELIEKEGLTIFLGVPSMYLILNRSLKEEAPPKPFFRLCVSGGAALPDAIAREFEEKFSLPIHQGYGLTEASPVCSVSPINLPPKLGSIGLPLDGVELRVVDEGGKKEVPRDMVGELAIRGDNVMKGYHSLPEETAKTILDGWLLTGDMARQDPEGYFYIVDRKKEMIIVAGENVYPREVEEVLYTHPDIAEAAVIGVPDQLRGEVPRAFVKLKENVKANKKAILNFCKERLANYKIPRTIRFIQDFPKNATGKILKKELASLS